MEVLGPGNRSRGTPPSHAPVVSSPFHQGHEESDPQRAPHDGYEMSTVQSMCGKTNLDIKSRAADVRLYIYIIMFLFLSCCLSTMA